MDLLFCLFINACFSYNLGGVWVLLDIICPLPSWSWFKQNSLKVSLKRSHAFTLLYVTMTSMTWVWQTVTVLLAVGGIKASRAIFLLQCKQLAASLACTINGQLIGYNHFYLSRFKIGSYPWNKQLLVKPSGNVASMLQAVVDQCFTQGGRLTIHNCWQALVEAQHPQINQRDFQPPSHRCRG